MFYLLISYIKRCLQAILSQHSGLIKVDHFSSTSVVIRDMVFSPCILRPPCIFYMYFKLLYSSLEHQTSCLI
ncbi:hypothetical protein OIU74_013443 [Salix koriyanagi]|uniref:Uncharacterized protein n=1 Tax=Salix koriyanagi TaxID=2511006 RepID=A0A9Q0T6H8_9ROSI|nr:hypothetical protein OIU74_013443 [Salix koriyanagi]